MYPNTNHSRQVVTGCPWREGSRCHAHCKSSCGSDWGRSSRPPPGHRPLLSTLNQNDPGL